MEKKNLKVFWTIDKLAVLMLILFFGLKPCLAQDRLVNDSEISAKKVNHNFYLGGKLGLIYVFGIEMNYVIQSQDVNRFYFAAAVQTSFVVNSINAGGGFFVGKKGLGIGCRYHHLLWFESESDSKIQPGYGPELVYSKTIGTKYIINLHAGGIITKGTVFPDISFGVFLPLNK